MDLTSLLSTLHINSLTSHVLTLSNVKLASPPPPSPPPPPPPPPPRHWRTRSGGREVICYFHEFFPFYPVEERGKLTRLESSKAGLQRVL